MENAAGTVGLLLPVVALVLLANLADKYRGRGEAGTVLAGITWAIVVGAYLLLAAIGGLVLLIGWVVVPDVANLPPEVAAFGFDGATLRSIGLWLVIPGLVGPLIALRPVRRLLARIMPFDATSTVAGLALALLPLVAVNLGITLAIGVDRLATLLEQSGATIDLAAALAAVWAQAALFVVLAFAGVGLFIRRDWRQSLERLGLVRPTFGQIGIGFGSVFLLLIILAVVLSVGRLFGLGVDAGVERLNEQLLGVLANNWLGILTIGLAAGIGEELLLRGALQPRFGLIATTLIFTALHANYGLSISTFVVFALGLTLGLVRQRTNTSTVIITHAGYNIAVSVIALLAPSALR